MNQIKDNILKEIFALIKKHEINMSINDNVRILAFPERFLAEFREQADWDDIGHKDTLSQDFVDMFLDKLSYKENDPDSEFKLWQLQNLSDDFIVANFLRFNWYKSEITVPKLKKILDRLLDSLKSYDRSPLEQGDFDRVLKEILYLRKYRGTLLEIVSIKFKNRMNKGNPDRHCPYYKYTQKIGNIFYQIFDDLYFNRFSEPEFLVLHTIYPDSARIRWSSEGGLINLETYVDFDNNDLSKLFKLKSDVHNYDSYEIAKIFKSDLCKKFDETYESFIQDFHAYSSLLVTAGTNLIAWSDVKISRFLSFSCM